MAGRLKRGEIRLCPFAKPDKVRPVLILTRSSAIRHLSRVTVAPITTRVRDVPSEVVIDTEDGMKSICAVNLHNLVTVPKSILGRRLASLSEARMRAACTALTFALGCSPSETEIVLPI